LGAGFLFFRPGGGHFGQRAPEGDKREASAPRRPIGPFGGSPWCVPKPTQFWLVPGAAFGDGRGPPVPPRGAFFGINTERGPGPTIGPAGAFTNRVEGKNTTRPAAGQPREVRSPRRVLLARKGGPNPGPEVLPAPHKVTPGAPSSGGQNWGGRGLHAPAGVGPAGEGAPWPKGGHHSPPHSGAPPGKTAEGPEGRSETHTQKNPRFGIPLRPRTLREKGGLTFRGFTNYFGAGTHYTGTQPKPPKKDLCFPDGGLAFRAPTPPPVGGRKLDSPQTNFQARRGPGPAQPPPRRSRFFSPTPKGGPGAPALICFSGETNGPGPAPQGPSPHGPRPPPEGTTGPVVGGGGDTRPRGRPVNRQGAPTAPTTPPARPPHPNPTHRPVSQGLGGTPGRRAKARLFWGRGTPRGTPKPQGPTRGGSGIQPIFGADPRATGPYGRPDPREGGGDPGPPPPHLVRGQPSRSGF